MSQDIGIQSNARANMYVKIKDSTGQMATVINPDPNAANVTSWTEWPLALTEFTTLNPSLNMLNIDSMTIGFQPGGSGLMFFDDVRLYPPRYISGYGTPLAIDFNNDGIVNYGDLDVMVGDWLKSDAEIATAVPGAANALWKFENNLSNSAGSGNGVAQGAVAYSAGAFGNALDLSTSSSYVTVADNPSVEFGAGSFSISVWIKDDFVANDPKEFVLCNGTNSSEFTGASGNRYALKFEGAGDFRFVIDDNVTKTIVNGNSDEFATGDWVHAAAVRDADAAELRIYCNGALANTQANVTTGDISSPGEGLYIGAKLQENAGAANLASTPIDHYYGGMMDELALYGRVLTDAEIAYLADTTPGDGTLYVPLTSAVNIVTKVGDAGVYNPANPDVVNFVDYAELLNHWLEEQLWPEP